MPEGHGPSLRGWAGRHPLSLLERGSLLPQEQPQVEGGEGDPPPAQPCLDWNSGPQIPGPPPPSPWLAAGPQGPPHRHSTPVHQASSTSQD